MRYFFALFQAPFSHETHENVINVIVSTVLHGSYAQCCGSERESSCLGVFFQKSPPAC